MEKFPGGHQLGMVSHRLLEEVLHCFNIMIGRGLNGFNLHSLFTAEICDQGIKEFVGAGFEGGHFSDVRAVGEALQPAHLHLHSPGDQAELTEYASQWLQFVAITPIEWGNGGE